MRLKSLIDVLICKLQYGFGGIRHLTLSRQKRTDSEISGNPHTSKTSVNIIEIQKKETDMSNNDPPSALNTVRDYDDDDDSLFNSAIDQDNAIGKAKRCMEIIMSKKKESTTVEFRKSTELLSEIMFYIIESRGKNPDMFQLLLIHSAEYEIISIYCAICVEILEDSKKYMFPPAKEETLHYMLQFLVTISDDSSEICSAISKQTHFLKALTKQLVDWTEPHSIQTLKEQCTKMLELICTILHNVAMFEDKIEQIRSVGCIEAMKPYLDSQDKTIRLLCLATLADLVNEFESAILQSNGAVIQFLVDTISMAMKAEEKSWDGWSLKELTRIVRKVARNDNNKRTVVQHEAIPLFIKMTKFDNIEEQREALQVIWTLSFDYENRSEMVNNQDWKVIETLEKLTQSPDDDIRTMSKNTLWTIQDRGTRRNDDTHVMISYNKGHRSMVKRITKNLRQNHIKVWIDVNDMQGSTIEAMASAVEKADIFLMCYSFKYKESNNCRAEAEYAFHLNKKIIPLKMEGNYKADGWLGIIIGTKLYYDFSEESLFEEKARDMLREVRNALCDLKRKLPILETVMLSTTNTQEQTKTTRDSVKKWTQDNVNKWLEYNRLPNKLLRRLTGEDVAFLYLLVHESPNIFYQKIKDQLGVNKIHTMAKLRLALDDLDSYRSS